MYFTWNVEMNDIDARGTHTDTQDKYHNPPAHVRRGLSCNYSIILSIIV